MGRSVVWDSGGQTPGAQALLVDADMEQLLHFPGLTFSPEHYRILLSVVLLYSGCILESSPGKQVIIAFEKSNI